MNATSPPEFEPPSSANLAKATGVALIIAAKLLVFVVLPAEYAIDPTGVGHALGLTKLSAPEEPAAPPVPPAGNEAATREDRVVIEVPAGQSLEYKFSLEQGQKLKYSWKVAAPDEGGTSPAPGLFFDFHGEPRGRDDGFFESYAISTATKIRGTLTAPFDGTHGWYWKNRGLLPAEVTLVTSGVYEVLGRR